MKIINNLQKDNRGASHHLLLPVIAVLMVAAIGGYVMTKSGSALTYNSNCLTRKPISYKSSKPYKKGLCIKKAQQALIAKKYLTKGSDSGVYDQKTNTAIKQFQSRNKLAQKGITKDTWKVLNNSNSVAADTSTAANNSSSTTTTTTTTSASSDNLDSKLKKEVAMMLVSSAENSSLNWRAQYGYIEDIGDGRGYTGGIIGFCSGTSDMLAMVQYYNTIAPNNALTPYIAALKKVDGTASHTGLGDAFVSAWKKAAQDPLFQKAQDYERDRVYFNPAVSQAKSDGLRALGQFAYYDAMVMHGPGDDAVSFGGIRAKAMKSAKTPARGGDEKTYLKAFLAARKAAMLTEAAHDDTSRVDTEQTTFLNAGNLNLNLPLNWSVYGDPFSLTEAKVNNYISTGKI